MGCRRCPSWVHSVNRTWHASTGFSQTAVCSFCEVNPTAHVFTGLGFGDERERARRLHERLGEFDGSTHRSRAETAPDLRCVAQPASLVVTNDQGTERCPAMSAQGEATDNTDNQLMEKS
jgi:hypothetical protein